MKLIVGSPGTWSGLSLRVTQCVFAMASIAAMASSFGFTNYSAFFYMILALMVQLIWSLALAGVDIFSIRNKKDIHTLAHVTVIVLGDWITAVLVFTGASASASVTILFTKDTHICRVYSRLACGQFALSVVVHRVVVGCCILFLWVLATGLIFVVVTHATSCQFSVDSIYPLQCAVVHLDFS